MWFYFCLKCVLSMMYECVHVYCSIALDVCCLKKSYLDEGLRSFRDNKLH